MGNKQWTTLLWYCSLALLVLGVAGKDILRQTLCATDSAVLECANRRYIIAIHNAYVSNEHTEGNVSCSSAFDGNNFTEMRAIEEDACVEDVRIPINRKCSGMKRCIYNYQSDPGRKCDIRRSVVVIHYACVRESTLYKYCNSRIKSSEGYIASPGYPLFYPRLTTCRWDIDAADGRIIVVQPLHLHLRPPTVTHFDEDYPIRSALHPDEIKCDVDYLRIEEGGVKKVDLCGESTEAFEAVQAKATNGMSLQFFSKEFFPGSGFLIYFKVKGCSTLSPPEDVHFVSRVGEDSLYRCEENLVFNDTLKNYRVLSCVGDERWNNTLHVPCVELEEVVHFHTNHSSDKQQVMELENMTNDEALGEPVSQKRTSFVEDIVVPSILMVILVIGNAIIIFIIFAVRRRHEAKRREEVERENNSAAPEEKEGQPIGQTTTV